MTPGESVASIFPDPIRAMPQADIPLAGVTAYLCQGPGQQVLFMYFAKDVELSEHSHEGQWGVVPEGEIHLIIGGVPHVFTKGDRYFIPAGVLHSGRIFAGYADMTYFDQKDRYGVKADR